MYIYNPIDQQMIDARVDEFRDQVRRYLDGKIDDAEFLQLRLRNGLYKQRHAYMLRVAIPYGLLSSRQMHKLADIATRYDKGVAHFTTRQNLQYNWPRLEQLPDLLAELAQVQMHAIQTSGNCVRNTTVDHLAGVHPDEIEDPRPYAEMVRQWSTLHPEFNYLPRKFKIAFTGRPGDGAAIQFHDIGVRLVRNGKGQVGFEILVGGGLGRTPIIGKTVRPFLEKRHLLSYIEAILRVYNLEGDRKNKFKARIKILVRNLGLAAFTRRVEDEWHAIKDGTLLLSDDDIERFRGHFTEPDLEADLDDDPPRGGPAYARWLAQNVTRHRTPGYRVVFVSLKPPGSAPGDVTAAQMHTLADLATRYSRGEIRTTHDQNLVLAQVRAVDLPALHAALDEAGLATPNIGLLTDMICCPGLDFCNLANAHSIPVADDIQRHFAHKHEQLVDIGPLQVKMSGCINACAHHHAGHIGILGVRKKDREGFQILLGGSAADDASLGRWIGPALEREKLPAALENITDVYREMRAPGESFLDCVRRVGVQPFHDRVYSRTEAS